MKRKIRTDTEYEVDGKWWLPDKPEKQVAGTFRFDPQNGSMLKLIGSLRFESLEDVLGASFLVDDLHMSDYPVIFGQTYDAIPVTLLDSWTKTSSVDAEGIFVNRALVGCHCPDRTTESFTGIRLRLVNLEQWVDHRAFTRESGFETPAAARQQLTIRVKDSALAEIRGPLPTINADVELIRGLTGSIGAYKANCEYQRDIVNC